MRLFYNRKFFIYFPFVLYFVGSLMIGEVLPFSKYDMYNFFPNNAISFRIVNHQNKTLPLKKYFNFSTADLSHKFSAENIKYNDFIKNKKVLEKWNEFLKENQKKEFNNDIISLIIIFYYIDGGKIKEKSFTIFRSENGLK
jgi:hypothetical protein